jgi:hypothetical protein
MSTGSTGKVIVIGTVPPMLSIDKDEFRRLWEKNIKIPQKFIPAMDHVAADLEFRTVKQNFNLFPADGKNSKLWERQNN